MSALADVLAPLLLAAVAAAYARRSLTLARRERSVPLWRQVCFVIAVRLTGAVLGNVLAWSGSPLYPDYAAGAREWGISPLSDQGAAGMTMMLESGVVTLGV